MQSVDAREAARLTSGRLGSWEAGPGWPHRDSAAGLSFAATGGRAFVVLDESGRIIGECGTKTAPSGTGEVEIGYGLAAPARGRGLGTQAVRLLLEQLAEDPAVRTVTAEVHVGNLASRRLLERLGFVPDGPETGGFLHVRRPVTPLPPSGAATPPAADSPVRPRARPGRHG